MSKYPSPKMSKKIASNIHRVGSSDGEPFRLDLSDDRIADPQAAAIASEGKQIIGFNAASRVDPRFVAIRKTLGITEKLVGALGMVYLLSIVTEVEFLEEALAGDLGNAIKDANGSMKRILEVIGKRIEMNGMNGRKTGENISMGEALGSGSPGETEEEKPKVLGEDGE